MGNLAFQIPYTNADIPILILFRALGFVVSPRKYPSLDDVLRGSSELFFGT
jgi:hypothetical protein